MEYSEIIAMLAGKYPMIGLGLMALGALVVVGQAIVVMTPSKSDDAYLEGLMGKPFIGKILAALAAFAPIQKK